MLFVYAHRAARLGPQPRSMPTSVLVSCTCFRPWKPKTVPLWDPLWMTVLCQIILQAYVLLVCGAVACETQRTFPL